MACGYVGYLAGCAKHSDSQTCHQLTSKAPKSYKGLLSAIDGQQLGRRGDLDNLIQ